jgi:hypothetical protein
MARYLQTAAEARDTINSLIDLVPEEDKHVASVLAAHVYNYGIRTAPRAVQSTVRLNAVTTACKDLPVSIRMEKRTDENTGRTFNVLKVE